MSVYGVLSGRLRVTVHGPESREHEVGEVARGESVGEPEVHEVDGSVLNTVPADVMRRFGRGPVVAVDVTAREDVRVFHTKPR